jgi:hypothetical protein
MYLEKTKTAACNLEKREYKLKCICKYVHSGFDLAIYIHLISFFKKRRMNQWAVGTWYSQYYTSPIRDNILHKKYRLTCRNIITWCA